jgi:hypothetical protein
MPSRETNESPTGALARPGIEGTVMPTAPKAPASAAIFIGAHITVQDAFAPMFDATVTASDSPRYPRKSGTDEEWLAVVLGIIGTSDKSETPVVAEALRLTALGDKCTVYVNTLAYGVRSTEAGKSFDVFPTIAAAQGWQQVESIARAAGCKIINL